MVTKEQLEFCNFNQINGHEFLHDSHDFLFNIKTQELFFTDDGMCEELICKIKDIEHLKEVIFAWDGTEL